MIDASRKRVNTVGKPEIDLPSSSRPVCRNLSDPIENHLPTADKLGRTVFGLETAARKPSTMKTFPPFTRMCILSLSHFSDCSLFFIEPLVLVFFAFALLFASTSTTMLTTLFARNDSAVLSLKEFDKKLSMVSPRMVTAGAGIVQKCNYWLEDLPIIHSKSSAEGQARDDKEDARDRLQGKSEWWSKILEPQQLLREEFYVGRISAYSPRNEELDDESSLDSSLLLWEPSIPSVVALDEFFDDASLLSCEDEDDDLSFVTAPDATFETFDDVSVLTEEGIGIHHSIGNAEDNLLKAINDKELVEFLVELCSISVR